ncbi:hypothetical protein LXL04_008135 [Taraxacum kok-saghyz]
MVSHTDRSAGTRMSSSISFTRHSSDTMIALLRHHHISPHEYLLSGMARSSNFPLYFYPPFSRSAISSIILLDLLFLPSSETPCSICNFFRTRRRTEPADELNPPTFSRGCRDTLLDLQFLPNPSFDEAEDDKNNFYPMEFLNSLNVSGLPPHYLRLKIGCPIILLRNIDPSNGLCNGTRLICKGFQMNVIDAEIAVGHHAGKRVFLPRIPLCPSADDMFPFKLKRKQFPIRLSFAMTINKAQGQTIPNVGIYLPESVFSHGQLYVALSRGISRENTKVLVKPVKEFTNEGVYTSNVVYREMLVQMRTIIEIEDGGTTMDGLNGVFGLD